MLHEFSPHRPFWAAERADKSYNMSLSIGDKLVKTGKKFNLFLWHGLSKTVEIYWVVSSLRPDHCFLKIEKYLFFVSLFEVA